MPHSSGYTQISGACIALRLVRRNWKSGSTLAWSKNDDGRKSGGEINILLLIKLLMIAGSDPHKLNKA